ncbi:hypothetical protein [Floridanema aerugineum]|uniref:Uncharacterized protein n=1 Tax=Floridaenema aerugineum BLCC-F46 TaxID=3153654 RepID=A0ABV4XDH2_9CYAN
MPKWFLQQAIYGNQWNVQNRFLYLSPEIVDRRILQELGELVKVNFGRPIYEWTLTYAISAGVQATR